jgi:peptidoglycan/xylan/chitin deacetylase (PgdA/CDA1 family)
MPLIPNKREFLARRLRDAGLLRLLERFGRRPGLLVLTYHRIGSPADAPDYYAPIWAASPSAFREQMSRLRDTYRVVTLAEAVELAESGFAVNEPTALVTFDDGYRDNFEVALPVLTGLGVPAAFFLPTSFLDEPRLPWWDFVALAVRRASVPTLRLDRPEPMEIDLGRTPRADAVARVIRACLDHHVDVNDERGFRHHLAERAGVVVDDEALGRALFMSWDQARALAATPGMAVGSHTQTHRNLARLSGDEQRAELADSRRLLESRLGRAIDALAYPYGWPGAFDAVTERLAAEAGYRLALTGVEGFNRPGRTDPFAVRRLTVGFADSPVLLRARMTLHAASGRSFL